MSDYYTQDLMVNNKLILISNFIYIYIFSTIKVKLSTHYFFFRLIILNILN